MKKLNSLLLLSLIWSCSGDDVSDVSNRIVFEEIWDYVDKNYIYFEYKNVDWDDVYASYSEQINEGLTNDQLLDVCADMVGELRDGHNSIVVPGERRRYEFREGYDIYFDLDVVRRNYLQGDYDELGFYTYGLLQDNIGYVHLASFSRVGLIHKVIKDLSTNDLSGIIIDIRDNTGGSGQDAVEIIGHFVQEPTPVGYIVEKTGKTEDNVSEPLSVIAKPQVPYLDMNVVLLTNRSVYLSRFRNERFTQCDDNRSDNWRRRRRQSNSGAF